MRVALRNLQTVASRDWSNKSVLYRHADGGVRKEERCFCHAKVVFRPISHENIAVLRKMLP